MKLVLRRPPFMCRSSYLSPMLLVLIVIQLASFVTPSLAYPLVSNNTLTNRQEGLIRRMDQPSLPSPGFPCDLHIAEPGKRFRVQSGSVTIQECANKGGFAWWPSPQSFVTGGTLEMGDCFQVGLFSTYDVTFEGTCIKEITAISLPKVYSEVHPCHVGFSLTRTKWYQARELTLSDCAKKGVAFWPGKSTQNVATCGLVWSHMHLINIKDEVKGTCFIGPPIPRLDHRHGLSPCEEGFDLNRYSPFYVLLPQPNPKVETIAFSKCVTEASAIAWRAARKLAVEDHLPCIYLPRNQEVDYGGRSGHCFGYDEKAYREWYLTKVLRTYRTEWDELRVNVGGGGYWIELRPLIL